MKVHLIAIGGSAMHNMALALHEKGFDVTGLDLSANSIQCAKQLESKSLRFLAISIAI